LQTGQGGRADDAIDLQGAVILLEALRRLDGPLPRHAIGAPAVVPQFIEPELRLLDVYAFDMRLGSDVLFDHPCRPPIELGDIGFLVPAAHETGQTLAAGRRAHLAPQLRTDGDGASSDGPSPLPAQRARTEIVNC